VVSQILYFSEKPTLDKKNHIQGEDSVRLHLQCFHGKAGFRRDPNWDFITGWRVSPSRLHPSMRQVRADGAMHGQKQRRPFDRADESS
jgi:hypothetical protein